MPRSEDELKKRMAELEERDKAQRAQLEAYGVDTAKTRKIDLTFWAPDEARAKELVAAMSRNELQPTLVLPPADESEKNQRWLVRSAVEASVDFITDTENRATFLLFADKYDCDFDGWGTAVAEAPIVLTRPCKT
jgi:Regulator of ribonuclease activity B